MRTCSVSKSHSAPSGEQAHKARDKQSVSYKHKHTAGTLINSEVINSKDKPAALIHRVPQVDGAICEVTEAKSWFPLRTVVGGRVRNSLGSDSEILLGFRWIQVSP
jgi:hypothetical protein